MKDSRIRDSEEIFLAAIFTFLRLCLGWHSTELGNKRCRSAFDPLKSSYTMMTNASKTHGCRNKLNISSFASSHYLPAPRTQDPSPQQHIIQKIINMAKSLVFITGGNNGLGYYATQQLAASGKYTVLMGSRDLSKAEKSIAALAEDQSMKVSASDIHPVQIDVTSDESISAAAKHVQEKYGYVDILMLNAGIAQEQEETKGSPSLRQIYQNHFDANLFGAAVTLEAFLPLLRKSQVPGGKRIAFTSSGLASLKLANESYDYNASMYPIYRSTKTAMSMIMLSYAKKLEGEGFVVTASDPGYCATDLNDHKGFKDPREGAKALVKAATGDGKKVHGGTVNEENDEHLAW